MAKSAREVELEARIAELESVRHTVKFNGPTEKKPDAKGTIQLTGINGKWGASYYANQWETIFSMQDAIKACIKANAAAIKALAVKAGKA